MSGTASFVLCNGFCDVHYLLIFQPPFSLLSVFPHLFVSSWLQHILFCSSAVLLFSSHWLTTVLIFSGWNQTEVFILFLPLLIDPPHVILPNCSIWSCVIVLSLSVTGHLISVYLFASLYPTISSLTCIVLQMYFFLLFHCCCCFPPRGTVEAGRSQLFTQGEHKYNSCIAFWLKLTTWLCRDYHNITSSRHSILSQVFN